MDWRDQTPISCPYCGQVVEVTGEYVRAIDGVENIWAEWVCTPSESEYAHSGPEIVADALLVSPYQAVA